MAFLGNAEETETVQQIENVTGHNSVFRCLHLLLFVIFLYFLFQVPLHLCPVYVHWSQEQGQTVPCLDSAEAVKRYPEHGWAGVQRS